MTPELFDKMLERIRLLVMNNATRKSITAAITGDDLPASTVLVYQVVHQYRGQEIELNLTTPNARPPYEWLAEITIRQGVKRKHFLLTDHGKLVEAYGRQLSNVTGSGYESLLSLLAKLN